MSGIASATMLPVIKLSKPLLKKIYVASSLTLLAVKIISVYHKPSLNESFSEFSNTAYDEVSF